MSMRKIRRRRSRKFVNDARRGYLRRVEVRKTEETKTEETTGLLGRVAGFLSKLFK